MLVNWLKRRIQLKAVQASREDIERFIDFLKGVPDKEVAGIVIYATAIRLKFHQQGIMPEDLFDWPNLNPSKPLEIVLPSLGAIARGFQQNGQTGDACALMVWLHSLRAYVMPEIRHLGQAMWSELQRGFPHTIGSWEAIRLVTKDPLPPSVIADATFVPPMLEPFRKEHCP